jgi:CheY-like chemotaxis protein
MYEVKCSSCEQTFDALQAAECTCNRLTRSYTCPHCGKCFCEAPPVYTSEFWKKATPEMWARDKTRTLAPSSTKEEPATTHGKLVLFADDDPLGRAIARQVVTSLGLGIVLAGDGLAALELARTYRPELIITDALMPKLDGREMAKTVKQEMPGIKVVVITSVYKDPRYKYEAYRDFGVDEYLAKPIKPEALQAVVTRYLGGT